MVGQENNHDSAERPTLDKEIRGAVMERHELERVHGHVEDETTGYLVPAMAVVKTCLELLGCGSIPFPKFPGLPGYSPFQSLYYVARDLEEAPKIIAAKVIAEIAGQDQACQPESTTNGGKR